MDVAYDHVQEEALSPTPSSRPGNDASFKEASASSDPPKEAATQNAGLNTELHQAISSIQSTQWGAAIGGWFSSARKQGESFVQDLQKEAGEVREEAAKGLTSLVERTKTISLGPDDGTSTVVPGEETVPVSKPIEKERHQAETKVEGKPESLPKDIVREAGTLVASLRSTAASRLKDLQQAEDAADEALLKFGTNIRDFLRDAVVVTAPNATNAESRELLFETSDPGTGRKVFHSSRLDAQLHAIHTTPSSFTSDPSDGETWSQWQKDFDVESMTADIARDLEAYPELRKTMESLVPEKVEYVTFWARYWFLRRAVEEDEKKRKEILKGAAIDPKEEVGWDDDDEEETHSSTPLPNKAASGSAETLTTSAAKSTGGLAAKSRSVTRVNEDESKSVADSDASYDNCAVSGVTSRNAESPMGKKKQATEDGSDEDWE